MKSEAAKTQEYLDKFAAAEGFYEKGRVAAELYAYLHGVSPAGVKAEILRCAAQDIGSDLPDEDRKEMDRGGIAWCDEQVETLQ